METLPSEFGDYVKMQGEDPKDGRLVLKAILIREGLLKRLAELAARVAAGERSTLLQSNGFAFVQLLVDIRAASVEVRQLGACRLVCVF